MREFCVWYLFCGVILGVLSSLAIILLRKRELVALYFSKWSLSLPQVAGVALQSVIVAFPGHTHL